MKEETMNGFLAFYKHYDGKFLNPENLKTCAEKLMNDCCIIKDETDYQIAEIEFYYYSSQHPDIITYPRVCSKGLWFFHQSGVDITIDSTKVEYGGILIRSIIRQDGEIICGPQNCVNELFNLIDIRGNNYSNIPIIDISQKKYDLIEIETSQRYIPFYIRKNDVEKLLTPDKSEEDIYKQLIERKMEEKFRSIKKGATEINIPSEGDFRNYVTAPYRFYLKGLESNHSYKYSPNPFVEEKYKYLYIAE
jgi:hypothetical protein